MRRFYIYPKLDPTKLVSPNPYVKNLEKALESDYNIVNKYPIKYGIFELYRFFFRTDIYLFNWIEDLPSKRCGKIQSSLFILFLWIASFFGKRIVWVMHNIYSHTNMDHAWTKYLFRLMIKQSSVIITHSLEGVHFIENSFPEALTKVSYVIHPMDVLRINSNENSKQYDLLIWGTVHKYKGVVDFLQYAVTSDLRDKKILVAGICPDPDLNAELRSLQSENIIFLEKFFDLDEISNLASISHNVLFTYNSESILSSGSLMDTITMGSRIIGPDRGAFKDLKEHGFISTFTEYKEIVDLVNNSSINNTEIKNRIKKFYNDNTWDLLNSKLIRAFEKIV